MHKSPGGLGFAKMRHGGSDEVRASLSRHAGQGAQGVLPPWRGENFADGGGQGKPKLIFLGKHFVSGSSAAVTLFESFT